MFNIVSQRRELKELPVGNWLIGLSFIIKKHSKNHFTTHLSDDKLSLDEAVIEYTLFTIRHKRITNGPRKPSNNSEVAVWQEDKMLQTLLDRDSNVRNKERTAEGLRADNHQGVQQLLHQQSARRRSATCTYR